MKRFLSAIRPLAVSGGFLLFFFLFSYIWETALVSSLKQYRFYVVGVLLLLVIIVVVLFRRAELKRFRSLPEQEKKAFISKSKKKLPFARLVFVAFIAILLFYLFFIRESSFPVWLKMNFPYILTVPFLIALFIYSYVVDLSDERKLKQSIQENETVTLKLMAIRSQLNPHFMFNALTSIQAANHYLSLFANLTRKVLNTSDQDLISLEDELKIQEDYLQMEQLRFGFQYNVKVGEDINIANTEIPAMLLLSCQSKIVG